MKNVKERINAYEQALVTFAGINDEAVFQDPEVLEQYNIQHEPSDFLADGRFGRNTVTSSLYALQEHILKMKQAFSEQKAHQSEMMLRIGDNLRITQMENIQAQAEITVYLQYADPTQPDNCVVLKSGCMLEEIYWYFIGTKTLAGIDNYVISQMFNRGGVSDFGYPVDSEQSLHEISLHEYRRYQTPCSNVFLMCDKKTKIVVH
jgi:hypothetical protein